MLLGAVDWRSFLEGAGAAAGLIMLLLMGVLIWASHQSIKAMDEISDE